MDDRKFNQVVETIDKAEKDVDKVLGAARLQRHAGPGTQLTGEQKFYLLTLLICCLTFLCALQIGCNVM